MAIETIPKRNLPAKATPDSRKRKRAPDEKLDAAFAILSRASAAQEQQAQNEFHIFGHLVGTKLQKYSHVAQTAVQQAIMNVLFDADRGCYDQRPAPHNPQLNPVNPHHSYPSTSSTPHDLLELELDWMVGAGRHQFLRIVTTGWNM
ncbi:hypothetical protein FQR65_LT15060 [Abscondita terminalis]|nr:hypothetical protein FQR65_LT15060 [Abscondita terminalis]